MAKRIPAKVDARYIAALQAAIDRLRREALLHAITARPTNDAGHGDCSDNKQEETPC